MVKRLFGVSTYLYHGQRLCREHLLAIAAHGFEAVDVFATRSHFDYHNVAEVANLQQWLAEAGLELHGIHAPTVERFEHGGGRGGFSIASTDEDHRLRAVAETERALHIARRIPAKVLPVHLGRARTEPPPVAADSRSAARRSLEALVRVAQPLGVTLALEVLPNELSRAGSLVHFIEHDLDGLGVGICLDFGHAHMDGDLVEAIETVAEHLVAADVHDNRGRQDEHLVPLTGTIDWAAGLTVLQKVGYDGTLMLEISARRSPADTLRQAQAARRQLERLLAHEGL